MKIFPRKLKLLHAIESAERRMDGRTDGWMDSDYCKASTLVKSSILSIIQVTQKCLVTESFSFYL